MNVETAKTLCFLCAQGGHVSFTNGKKLEDVGDICDACYEYLVEKHT